MRVTRLPAAALPPGGSPGDVLTRTAGGAAWAAPVAGGGGGTPGGVAYSQYRLNITANSGGPFTEVADLALLDAQGQNIATGGAASASSSLAGSTEAPLAFDGSAATAWVAEAAPPQTLNYTLGSPVALTTYSLTSSSGLGRENRAPKTWTLEGSNDGASWTVLHTVADAGAWADGQTKTYTI